MANNRKTQPKKPQAPELTVEQMKQKLAEREAAELKQYTEDFKQWLEERRLTLSVRTIAQDNQAQHVVKLVRK